jgi:protein SCO1/2
MIYLMDREGKFVAPFNLKRTPQEAAAELKQYL